MRCWAIAARESKWEAVDRAAADVPRCLHVEVRADAINYNSQITEKGVQWHLALTLLEEWQQCNLEPDAMSCHATINA